MRVARYVAVGLAVLAVTACSGEENKVKNVVRVYNKVLAEAYSGPKPELMENFTTKRESIRIDNYISLMLKNNKILSGEIKELTFDDVDVGEDEAEAGTKERWVYSYLDARTRKPLSRQYDVLYENTYYLEKKDGRWVVAKLESKEVGGEGEEAEDEDRLREMHEGLLEKMKEEPGR